MYNRVNARRLLTVSLGLLAVAVLCSCEVRRKGLTIAPPKVYPPLVARASLQVQSDQTVAAARKLSASQLNQMRAGRQSIEQQFGIQAAQAGGTVPTAAAGGAATLPPAAVAAPGPGDYGPLFPEGLDDLTAKEAEIEGMRLLYAGDASLDGTAKLYLVRFDISLNPSRQNYLAYPFLVFGLDWNGVPPSFTGVRNYRKDYQVEVNFLLPEGVEVYAVQPANQNLTALDSVAYAQQLGFTAAFAQAPWAAQYDYRDRIEEQFAEQRKFPLIQGVIDNPRQFHFVFNPRRRAVRRSWVVSWIPGVGRYTTKLFLEPGVRRVYAYLLVRKPDELGMETTTSEDRVVDGAPGTDAAKSVQVNQYLTETVQTQISAEVDRTRGVERREGSLRLKVPTWGWYVDFDDPYRRDRIEFERRTATEPVDLRQIEVDLPLSTATRTAHWTIDSVNHIGNVKLDNVVMLRGPKGVDYSSLAATVFASDDGHGEFVPLPAKLVLLGVEDGAGIFEIAPLPKKPAKGPVRKLRLLVKAGAVQGWTDELTYEGPWAEDEIAPKAQALSSKAGVAMDIEVPRQLGSTTIKTVRGILFGDQRATITKQHEVKASQPFKFTLIVPQSDVREVDLFAEVDATEADTDPQLYNATKDVTTYIKLRTFTYASPT